MAEELRLTMEGLEGLWRARGRGGWQLRVYDYTANEWREAEEAFGRAGTYELAVLTPPGGAPVRVRVLPPGTRGLMVEAGSVGDLATWQALGVRPSAGQLALMADLVEGREGPIALEELATLLEREGGGTARGARRTLEALLEGDGGW